MPLPDAGRPVAGGFHTLGNRFLFGPESGQARIAGKSGMPGELSGHQAGARSRTDRSRIELCETHAALRQCVHVGRIQVGGTETIHVQRPVVVGIDDDDVGFCRLRMCRSRQQKAAGA